jgi:hypothetical protein
LKISFSENKWELYSNGIDHSTVISIKKRGFHQTVTNQIDSLIGITDNKITPIEMKKKLIKLDDPKITPVIPTLKQIANYKYRNKCKIENEIGLSSVDDLLKWIDESISNCQASINIQDNEMVILSKVDYSYYDEDANRNITSPGFVFSSKNCIKNIIESVRSSNTFTSDGVPMIALNGDATFNLMREKWCLISLGPRSFNEVGEDISHHYRPGNLLYNITSYYIILPYNYKNVIILICSHFCFDKN